MRRSVCWSTIGLLSTVALSLTAELCAIHSLISDFARRILFAFEIMGRKREMLLMRLLKQIQQKQTLLVTLYSRLVCLTVHSLILSHLSLTNICER